ncbi:uncharacterized protein with GYD domain [Cryobacterium sp. MP_M5]|uniref:hypothetical protein n=1 Tax=unclassified Cryobacterium TaxID=2649013 RepID=UPI0018C8E6B1|nr:MULTISPECIES: hypothetical protein [unclassified Cryobacterium]MBG6059760.1 uncharacterized protein with GYD domain [Cryobacterium sp. MP_M3]MEC5178161.1 uncharacterized protein with GYD domain [Cryobacterium sp. MP_M5]
MSFIAGLERFLRSPVRPLVGIQRRQFGQLHLQCRSVGREFLPRFGEIDDLGVIEVPKPSDVAALSLLINLTGSVPVRLNPLLTVEDLDDDAVKKTPAYRAPGQ